MPDFGIKIFEDYLKARDWLSVCEMDIPPSESNEILLLLLHMDQYPSSDIVNLPDDLILRVNKAFESEKLFSAAASQFVSFLSKRVTLGDIAAQDQLYYAINEAITQKYVDPEYSLFSELEDVKLRGHLSDRVTRKFIKLVSTLDKTNKSAILNYLRVVADIVSSKIPDSLTLMEDLILRYGDSTSWEYNFHFREILKKIKQNEIEKLSDQTQAVVKKYLDEHKGRVSILEEFDQLLS